MKFILKALFGRGDSGAGNAGPLTGHILEGYQVLDLLGKGGMAAVYRGRSEEGQEVAIKVLSHEREADAEYRARFRREARTLIALDHPHIIKVFGMGESEGVHYMVMELVTGERLRGVMKRYNPMRRMPFGEAYRVISELANALDYAHARGLVHRDLKPGNIMIRHDPDSPLGRCVLMDFGIAKISDVTTRYTGEGGLGSLDYMAPEQIRAARDADHRADVYSLGLIFYEMLAARHPFVAFNDSQMMTAHLEEQPPHPHDLIPDIPGYVATAILQSLAKNPEDRFQSAGAFVAALS